MGTTEFIGRSALLFLAGSLPFAFIAAKVFGGKDIREVADGNPGAVNAFRTAGPVVGSAVLLLDFLKGVVPLLLWLDGASSWQKPVLAMMPVLGHAFMPWLGFKGGKAITTSFGVWTALTMWEGPVAMGAGAVLSLLLAGRKSEYVKAATIMASLGAYLAITGKGAGLWAVFAADAIIMGFKQWQYESRTRKGARRWS